MLDLFAGTGALGIESLSRGADSALFMDIAKESCRIIRNNIKLCRLEEKATLLNHDLSKTSLPREVSERRFNFLFMDPPYGKDLIEKVLGNDALIKTLTQNAIIIVEHSPDEPVPENFQSVVLFDQRKYGKTRVSFLSIKRERDELVKSPISGYCHKAGHPRE